MAKCDDELALAKAEIKALKDAEKLLKDEIKALKDELKLYKHTDRPAVKGKAFRPGKGR